MLGMLKRKTGPKEAATDKPLRKWHRNLFRIPFEHFGRFVTHDGVEYWRHPKTGVIRRMIPKVRGKKARARDKFLRRRLV